MERDRRPNVVVFVVWSALIDNWWVVVAWGGRKYCLGLTEISSLVFLVLFKDGMQGEATVSSLGGL